MKHSPAPWTLIEGDDEGDVIIQMDKSHQIVIGNLENTCGTCHANARLVKAAPELLRALERITELMYWRIIIDNDKAVIRQALDAMNEATGGDIAESLRNIRFDKLP